jgi:5-methylcytosine-specific restriction enzyme subunit McrC
VAETLTLFEHETREFDWTGRDVALLERLRQGTAVDVLRPTIRRGKHILEATEHVGVVRLGNRLVQVLPKIYRVDSRDGRCAAREATRNLLYLLAYAGKLTIREHAIVPLLERDADWFEILTNLFATHFD